MTERDSLNEKLESTRLTIQELESQLQTTVQDVARYQMSATQMEIEMAEFRKERNLAVDEKDELAKMLERRNHEIERLRSDVTTLTNQLENAVAAKCQAMATSEEVASKKLALEFQEKRIQQERILLNGQVHQLTQDLNQRTEELLNMRRDNTSRCIQLETKLAEKMQELACANENIKALNEINNNLMMKAEDLADKLFSEKDAMLKTKESFEHELEAKTKLAELYKTMSEDKLKVAEELAEGMAEVKAKYDDAIEKYGDLETKFKEAEIAHEEILEKKNECIAMLKRELEAANDVLNSTKEENFKKGLEGKSLLKKKT